MTVRLGLSKEELVSQIIFVRARQCTAKAYRENTVGMFKDPSAAGAEMKGDWEQGRSEVPGSGFVAACFKAKEGHKEL